MDDLTAFDNARLDADEQWAKDLIACGPGDVSGLLGIAQRMLSDVAAKRAIVALHHREHVEVVNADQDERSGDFCAECAIEGFPCPTRRAVTAVWSDHPGYKQEWAPIT